MLYLFNLIIHLLDIFVKIANVILNSYGFDVIFSNKETRGVHVGVRPALPGWRTKIHLILVLKQWGEILGLIESPLSLFVNR